MTMRSLASPTVSRSSTICSVSQLSEPLCSTTYAQMLLHMVSSMTNIVMLTLAFTSCVCSFSWALTFSVRKQ